MVILRCIAPTTFFQEKVVSCWKIGCLIVQQRAGLTSGVMVSPGWNCSIQSAPMTCPQPMSLLLPLEGD
ncbi:hypothetical protein KBZ34_16580 [Cyanobium sp. Cruz-8H5]|nr:hypothetical protein [Cyanobium sp. Cruz-8H5]